MGIFARTAALAWALGLAPLAVAADAPEEKTHAFIGLAAGSGTARYTVNGTTRTFSDTFEGATDEAPLVAVKVLSFGVEVKPNLFAGADLTGVAQSGTVGTNKTDLQINNYLATLTWFPWERGLFLKVAAGVSSLFVGSGTQSDRVWGAGGLVSAGFALRLSGAHHLTFTAEEGWQRYYSSGDTRPDSSQYNAFYLGYMWRD
jgi:hypothetical protein